MVYWRHKVRGTWYEVLVYDALGQWSKGPAVVEAMEWVVYCSVRQRGWFFIRPYQEFTDGRFEGPYSWWGMVKFCLKEWWGFPPD